MTGCHAIPTAATSYRHRKVRGSQRANWTLVTGGAGALWLQGNTAELFILNTCGGTEQGGWASRQVVGCRERHQPLIEHEAACSVQMLLAVPPMKLWKSRLVSAIEQFGHESVHWQYVDRGILGSNYLLCEYNSLVKWISCVASKVACSATTALTSSNTVSGTRWFIDKSEVSLDYMWSNQGTEFHRVISIAMMHLGLCLSIDVFIMSTV